MTQAELERPRRRVTEPLHAFRQLIRERAALLRLLRVAGLPVVATLGALMVLTSLLPAATAVAVGGVVQRVVSVAGGRADLASVGYPLAVVGILLTADQVSATLLMPLRNWVATRVNGEVRRTVRQAVAVRPGIDHLEDQVVRDAATLPIDNAYLFNLGAGAEGQLWLMTRFVGAATAALVVATFSLPAAVVALAALVWQRALLRHHYAKAIATAATSTTGEGRAALYWSEVAGAPLGAKELRVFGYKDWALQQFARFGEVPLQQVTKVVVDALPLHWKIFGLNTVGGLVPFLLLGWRAAGGGIDAAGLATALGGVVAVARVLGSMGWEAYSIEASVPQLEAVRRLERYHREETAAASSRQPVLDRSRSQPAPVPTITFESVAFSYPGTEHNVLENLDLELVPGQSVAIVGENGAGKTTLLKLLSRFYTPTAGRILIDGRDLQELDPRWWRKHLAVIFQDFVHFELTALDNVALAELSHPDRRRHAAAAAAAAGGLDLIESLPDGWDTVLSRAFSGGVELSGGQWQRVALARALYAARVGGTVLVLDEPTASLDVSAEVALFDQLIDHARGLTAIIVSHRFSTVRRAERIVVIADGHVIEDGDHRTLHSAGATYATLFDLQASRFQDNPVSTPGEPT